MSEKKSLYKKSGEEKKNNFKFIVIIIILCVVVVGVSVFAIVYRSNPNIFTSNTVSTPKPDLDPGAVDYIGEGPAEKGNASNSQTEIPGYGEITLDTKTGKIDKVLFNPEGNPVYFVVRIFVNNKEVYKSKMIPPGQAIYEAKITETIEPGEYKAVLQYECFHITTLNRLNGADTNLTFIVK